MTAPGTRRAVPEGEAEAVRRPSRAGTHIDEMAVARRVAGDQSVYVTKYERRECVRQLHALGMNDGPIARRLGISDRTVLRIRGRLGLPANEMQRPMPAHGSPGRYRRGCRCLVCREGNNGRTTKYRRRAA